MQNEEIDLSKYVKYARDYLNLSRGFRSGGRSSVSSTNLSEDIFDLVGLLNGDLDGHLSEEINLQYVYNAETEEEKETDEYKKEEKIAQGLENLIFKFKNNQFTQELRIKFCFVKYQGRAIDPETGELTDFQDFEAPLCSIGILVTKDQKTGRYSLSMTDDQVQVHIEQFWHFVDEKIYYQLTKILTEREKDSGLFLPKEDLSFVKDLELEFKSATQTAEHFEIKDFKTAKVEVAVQPKSNYFLVEDLESLSKIESAELEGSALSTWTEKEDAEFYPQDSDHKSEAELFFPFPYDKFKLQTLPLLRNTVSIIEGPPGTGKSELIANILVHLAASQKKVLFVSQKSQALKVVKDKLKTLDVDGLFAYFPNKNASVLSDADHSDSVTSAFSKVERLLESNSNQTPLSVREKFNDITESRSRFNSYFEQQRTLFELKTKLNQDLSLYKDAVLSEVILDIKSYKELRDLYESKVEINERINSFEGEEYDLIDTLPFNKEIVDILQHIAADFSATAHDRSSKLRKAGNNLLRRTRLKSSFKQLPNEVNVEIKKIEQQYASKHDASLRIDALSQFVTYRFNKIESERIDKEFVRALERTNTSEQQVVNLVEIQDKLDLRDKDFVAQINLYQDIEDQISQISNDSFDPNTFTSSESRNFTERKQRIKIYLANIVRKRASQILSSKQSLKIITRLAKAFSKSKAAYKTFDKLKSKPQEFQSVYSAFPIWIMELDDASRILPLEKELFDYVILDESSQCDIAYTLPAMFRAKKAVFVGDSKQMKSTTTGFLSNRVLTQLAEKYEVPEHMQIKPVGEAAMSVLDIFKLQGVRSRTLQYHYRSPKELIGFSSENFYKPFGTPLISLNKDYLTYKDTGKIIVKHKIDVDYNNEISEKTNRSEALEILRLYNDLRKDSNTADLSVGVLTFFNEQSLEIRSVFEEVGIRDENLLISTIEGVQGDEKDIIIYSFAIKAADEKNRYVALTGENGDVRKEVNNGRVNVAFSRAKKQVHIVTSLDTHEFPSGVWLKKYLEYADAHGSVHESNIELSAFDSYFEEEFYALVSEELGDGYLIQNQIDSLGFKIDFVITNLSNGKKLAVECDGPTHFADDLSEEFGNYVESDVERQLALEAAGWNFYRISYSRWINDRKLSDIAKEIEVFLS